MAPTKYIKPKGLGREEFRALCDRIFQDVASGYSIATACRMNNICWINGATRAFMMGQIYFFKRYCQHQAKQQGPIYLIKEIAIKKHGEEWWNKITAQPVR